MAEFDNFRRRTSQEKLNLVNVAAEDTIKGLLPVLDDCERAMDALAKSDDNPAAKEGTELIYGKLTGYLQTKGLSKIEALGAEFDTDLHEAVAQFPVEDADDDLFLPESFEFIEFLERLRACLDDLDAHDHPHGW